ncbi:MAG: 3-isopropylmalate dehydratase small subunit [Sulfobacillus acidophilus]|uniref:3-isopropylmalate dehydratase small subunit n=1 Tax=Sulfobacillus acidophilus TaxID=53633 RepID=A0A2T2WKP5_9FIRM|nr:MAG: 3-isopropylmalate dehydratase small subunit [Sulfobacillus acidophilus]
MTPFSVHRGQVAPLKRNNVDTDQIIPKQFLKRIERTGFGQFLFYDWRYDDQGQPRADFVLNQAPYNHASILLSKVNFGCGSSREHAPWALADFGFRAIIAVSFADIFYNNCFENGLLPITVDEETVDALFDLADRQRELHLTIDLSNQTIVTDDGSFQTHFPIDAERKQKLLKGLDSIGETLLHDAAIASYEKTHALPTVPSGL